MVLPEDVARLADEIRQVLADVKTEIASFPSGAVSLDIRINGHVFVLDYIPSQGMFGVDELTDDGGFNSGYRFGFQDFKSARLKLLDLLEKAKEIPVPNQ